MPCVPLISHEKYCKQLIFLWNIDCFKKVAEVYLVSLQNFIVKPINVNLVVFVYFISYCILFNENLFKNT